MVVDNAGDSLLKISNTPTTFFFLELKLELGGKLLRKKSVK